MKLPNNTGWLMAPLAAAILIPGVHAKEPIFSSSDFDLKYGGAISNEEPTIFVEIPQLTKDLASSLEHDILDASNIDGNVVWNVEEFSRETLLRTYQHNGETAFNMQIFVDGEELLPFTYTNISVTASGSNDETGTLQFLAWPASAYRTHNTNSGSSWLVEYGNGHTAGYYGNEYPSQILLERYGAHKMTQSISNPPNHTTWASYSGVHDPEHSETALATYVYSDEMQLAFPENDYPEQWSAVVDIEVVVL